MSRRSAPFTSRNRRRSIAAGLLLACALTSFAVAQPDALDTAPPLPPKEPERTPVAVRFRFPGSQSPLFSTIEDKQPVRSEKENPGEYAAWNDLILWAKNQPTAELEAAAIRNLTPDDLRRGIRTTYRFEPIRFDGKLTDVRRVPPTKALADAGVPDVYEAWLTATDSSPANPLCLIFTELPSGFSVGAQPADRWVSFAGYSFKLLSYPGPEADAKNPKAGGWLDAPLLVGRTITALAGPPAEATALALNKELRVFKLIQDDQPMARDPDYWEEAAAWNRVVLHARKFTAEQLEEAARKDLDFAHLFETGRRDYKLELVHFKGQLLRISKGETNKELADAGVPNWYEGWLVPKDEPRGNPICIVMTDLPPGLEPAKAMNEWVSFAGYSFKRMHYTSGEQSKRDPSRNVHKAAPLLIGRSVTLLPGAEDPNTWAAQFVPLLFGGLLLIVGVAVGLHWWYKRGDVQAKAEADAVRYKNPFGGA